MRVCVCVRDGEGALGLCAALAQCSAPCSRQPGKSDYSWRCCVSVLNVPKCDGTCSLPAPGRRVSRMAAKLRGLWELNNRKRSKGGGGELL